MARNQLIRFLRGAQSSIPTLNEGEPGFCTDTGKLFVGSSSGNKEIGASSLNNMSTEVTVCIEAGATGTGIDWGSTYAAPTLKAALARFQAPWLINYGSSANETCVNVRVKAGDYSGTTTTDWQINNFQLPLFIAFLGSTATPTLLPCLTFSYCKRVTMCNYGAAPVSLASAFLTYMCPEVWLLNTYPYTFGTSGSGGLSVQYSKVWAASPITISSGSGIYALGGEAFINNITITSTGNAIQADQGSIVRLNTYTINSGAIVKTNGSYVLNNQNVMIS